MNAVRFSPGNWRTRDDAYAVIRVVLPSRSVSVSVRVFVCVCERVCVFDCGGAHVRARVVLTPTPSLVTLCCVALHRVAGRGVAS